MVRKRKQVNRYSFGGGFKKGLGDSKFDISGLGESLGANIGSIGSTVGNIAGKLISNGYESDAGKVLDTIGDIGGMVPGPWGAAIGVGAKVLGGAANALFGTKVDQEKLNASNAGIAYLNNFRSNAASFDDIKGPQEVAFANDIYKGGVWNKGKARRQNEAIGRRQRDASMYAERAVDTNISNLISDQASDQRARFYSFGGPFDFGVMPIGGAIDYELAQKRLQIMGDKNKGKGISPVYAFGGALPSNGADWTNGVVVIGNGGTHEQNPFEGVQMGIAPDGAPNLVEEGEVVWKDYVFSRRIKVPEKVKEKYKLKGEDLTFADAVNAMQKSSAERPNDPIAKRTLDINLGDMAIEQENIRQRKEARKRERLFAQGGDIHIKPSKRGTFTAAASKHGMGVQEFANKVLANKEDYSPAMVKKANFARNASKWKHAEGGPLGHKYYGLGDDPNYLDFLYPEMGEEPDTILNKYKYKYPKAVPINNATYWAQYHPDTRFLTPWTQSQPVIRGTTTETRSGVTETGVPVYTGIGSNASSKFNSDFSGPSDLSGSPAPYKGSWLTGLRYVPALGAALGVTTDLLGLTNKPDYSNADLLLEAANEATNNAPNVRFRPIGNYLAYRPLDRLFYANQLGAQASAARRAIRNVAGGNRGAAMTGIIASDYNAQNQLGNLFRQAEEYNLAQRERVENFNRATNEFNSEGFLKEAIANADNYAKRSGLRLSALEKAAAIRDAVDARASAGRSANLTNLFDSLGAIGEDELNRQDARWLAPLIYGAGADRAPSLRGLWANGGRINKRKKGLTYG